MAFWRKNRPPPQGLPGVGNQLTPVASRHWPLYPEAVAAVPSVGPVEDQSFEILDGYRYHEPPGTHTAVNFSKDVFGLPKMTGVGPGTGNVAQLMITTPGGPIEQYLPVATSPGQSWNMSQPGTAPLLTPDQLASLYPNNYAFLGASPIPVNVGLIEPPVVMGG